MANLPGLCFQEDHDGNNSIQKSVAVMSFQNKLEMSKQFITHSPLYLPFHALLSPHVGPKDTVPAKGA